MSTYNSVHSNQSKTHNRTGKVRKENLFAKINNKYFQHAYDALSCNVLR